MSDIDLHKVVTIFFALMLVQAVSALLLRTLGARKGLFVSSFLGGFISSTAVTMTLARASRTQSSKIGLAGIVFASIAMLVEIAFIIYIGSRVLFVEMLPIWLVIAGMCVGLMAFADRISSTHLKTSDAQLIPRFSLLEAVKLSLTLVAMLVLIGAVQKYFGQESARLISFLGSLFEVHSTIAANLNVGTPVKDQLLTILLCLSAGLLSKIGIAWLLGSIKLAQRVTVSLGALIAAMWLAAIVIGL